MRIAPFCLALSLTLAGCGTTRPVDRAALERQVADTEHAFAKTMADRDHAAFGSFLSEETVFFSGPKPLRGKAAVAGYWKRFYEKPAAPASSTPRGCAPCVPTSTRRRSRGCSTTSDAWQCSAASATAVTRRSRAAPCAKASAATACATTTS